MSDIRQSIDEGIDFLAFLETLWNAKWVIVVVTAAASILGLALAFSQPVVYKFSTTISKSSDAAFIEFLPLNVIKKEISDMVVVDPKGAIFGGNIIGGAYTFDTFVSQFSDYKKMFHKVKDKVIFAGDENNFISRLEEKEFIALASKFKIVAPPKPDGKWVVGFEWSTAEEGKNIIDQLINTGLESTKAQIIAESAELSDQLKKVNAAQLAELNSALGRLLDQARTDNKKKIAFLRQQSAIAKELGMDDYQLGANPVAGAQYLVLSEQPYYLRGFKSIDKEIALIELETEQDMLIKKPEYAEIVAEIGKIESDTSIAQIDDLVDTLNNKSVEDWILVDRSGRSVTSNWNPKLALILSGFLGFLIAVMYAIGLKEIQKWKAAREQIRNAAPV